MTFEEENREMANTRQQDFVLLAKGHYGQVSTALAAKILSYHAWIEPKYIRQRDLAKVLLGDLRPLLSESQLMRFIESLIECDGTDEFITNLLGSVSTVVARDSDGNWILPFGECEADPKLKNFLSSEWANISNWS